MQHKFDSKKYGHPIVIGFPSLFNILCELGVGTKLLGFMLDILKIENSNKTNAAMINQQMVSKSIEWILREIQSIQNNKGIKIFINGKPFILFPYIAFHSQASKESLLTNAARSCAICKMSQRKYKIVIIKWYSFAENNGPSLQRK